MSDSEEQTGSKQPLWLRLWPVYLIAAGLALAWYFGLFKYFSLESLRENREVLKAFVANNFILAFALYIVVYALATLFMMPGALWITIAGGFLFGLAGGTPATVIGATLGASMLFFAAKTSVGSVLRNMAGSYAEKIEGEFKKSPLSYMFAMRFVPAMPFPIANIVPALLDAKYRDYFITTAIGIIPGVIAYTWIGAGLDATFAAGEDPDLQSVFWNLLPALIALVVVSLIPVVYKKFSNKADKLESLS